MFIPKNLPGKYSEVKTQPDNHNSKNDRICKANIEGIKFFNVSEANISQNVHEFKPQHMDEFKLK